MSRVRDVFQWPLKNPLPLALLAAVPVEYAFVDPETTTSGTLLITRAGVQMEMRDGTLITLR